MLRRTLTTLGLALALVTPQVALAQSRTAPVEAARAPANGKATIEVMVVHATDDTYVDPALRDVMQNLKSTRFTGFKLISQDASRLAPGGDSTVNMPGNRRLKVTLLEKLPNAAKVRIRMFKEGDKVLDTTVSIPDGKYMMIAGPKYKDGKLVIPVGVTF